MKSTPIVDVVFQSGVAPFSPEIANSNSIPNPISPLGKKTDPTKAFKYRFSQDLPVGWLYRFQMAPEKNTKKPVDKLQERIITKGQSDNRQVDSNNYEENLISYTSSLRNNASPFVKHLVKKTSKSLENAKMDSTMPPSFKLKADQRIIKQRMPFLVMHENPFKQKDDSTFQLDSNESDEVVNQTPHINEPNLDKCGSHFYEETSRGSYDQYVEMQQQIVNIKNLQRTKQFLPDHVPKYVRKMAQQNQKYSGQTQTMRPLNRTVPNRPLTIQAKSNQKNLSATNKMSKTAQIAHRPFTTIGNTKSMTKKLKITSINKGTKYSFVDYYDCTRDDDEILERVAIHNSIAKEMMDEKRREMESQANSYQQSVKEKMRLSQLHKEKPELEDNQAFKRKIVNLMMNNETEEIEQLISARIEASARAAQESDSVQYEEEDEDESQSQNENQAHIKNIPSRVQNILLE